MSAPVIVRRTLMGSPFEMTAWPGGPAEAAILTAYSEVARVEDLITDWRDSPLERLNAAAGGPPVPVSEELFDLVEFALGVCRDSGGAFDITYAPVGMLWRGAFRTGIPPAEEAIDRAMRLVGHRKVETDRRRGTIRLPEKGMRIGLGSIGKSYGVDRAARVLLDLGLKNFSVNGGGDIRLSSAPGAPRPWKVAVKNPFAEDGRAAAMLELGSGGVATSGDYERCFVHGGRRYHHIIDARTGRVRSDIASVTVTASTAALANACATSVMALGPEEGAAFLLRRRDASGFIISAAGEVRSCNIRMEPAGRAYAAGRS